MSFKKRKYSRCFKNILCFLVVFILFYGCKVYHHPTTLEQAATSNDKGYMKITMLNGDEYIYSDLEVVDGNYYGISTKNGEKITTILKKEEIKNVQRHNKKSSGFFNVLGITVGIGSIFLAISMFSG